MEKLLGLIAGIAVVIVGISVVVNSFRINNNKGEITRLKVQINCLKHPHAESSIAGKLVGKGKNRHFVLTQPSHKTGC